MTQSGKTFLMMAGGTGGHIFPALAVAQSLQQMGHKVVWLGSEGSMEERLVPQYGIPVETVAMKGVRGKGLWRKLTLPWMLLRSVQAAVNIIRRHKIDAVIGFGGFVTFPGGMAAKAVDIPIIIHEQNAVAGMANRRLAKWAARVLYAFPKAFEQYPDGLVGNPIRADIAQLPKPEERFAGRSGPLRIFIIRPRAFGEFAGCLSGGRRIGRMRGICGRYGRRVPRCRRADLPRGRIDDCRTGRRRCGGAARAVSAGRGRPPNRQRALPCRRTGRPAAAAKPAECR